MIKLAELSDPATGFVFDSYQPAMSLTYRRLPSSWPGVSGPSAAAHAGIGGPDKPGHDHESRSHRRLGQVLIEAGMVCARLSRRGGNGRGGATGEAHRQPALTIGLNVSPPGPP